jgi:hypothetical protein
MVAPWASNPQIRVRFPSPAPDMSPPADSGRCATNATVGGSIPPGDTKECGCGVLVARQVASLNKSVRFRSLTPRIDCLAERQRRCLQSIFNPVRLRKQSPEWAVSDSGSTSGLHPESRSSILLPSTILVLIIRQGSESRRRVGSAWERDLDRLEPRIHQMKQADRADGG